MVETSPPRVLCFACLPKCMFCRRRVVLRLVLGSCSVGSPIAQQVEVGYYDDFRLRSCFTRITADLLERSLGTVRVAQHMVNSVDVSRGDPLQLYIPHLRNRRPSRFSVAVNKTACKRRTARRNVRSGERQLHASQKNKAWAEEIIGSSVWSFEGGDARVHPPFHEKRPDRTGFCMNACGG